MRPSPAFDFASSGSSDEEDHVSLPFPAALPRSDFLAADFHPAEYLSALPNRHQTLEDLRSELRERTAAIGSELLELVNSNYISFLSLGSELRGGDDKVQDVRVSLLGFWRAVDDIKDKVTTRRKETESLTNQLRDVRCKIEQGRKMLELSERLSALEDKLALESLPREGGGTQWAGEDSDEEDGDQDDGGEGQPASPARKLLARARECSRLMELADSLDKGHVFVATSRARLTKCRNTLVLDVNNALKEARKNGSQNHDEVLGFLGIYRLLNAQNDAIKTLRRG